MFSVFSRLAKPGDGKKSNGPSPMSSSLQKKFSKGVDYNMKILIKGDRNVGKSCLLQRLQGGPFIEEYQSTDQIQIAPIHWKYKDTDHIIKVEVWEVVDKGRVKKKPSGGLKFENSSLPPAVDSMEIPPLDASFLDVYANANGVIMMMDVTKAWTFEYVKREIASVPADIPVIILGNHCDMHHHREVTAYQAELLVSTVRQSRSGAVRYAETSMRNGFGLRLLHKFFNIPFLQLQRVTLLNQLSVNGQELELASKELDDFEKSEDADYEAFLDKLTSKRQESNGSNSTTPRIATDKSPSIVLGGGKPIIPQNINPLAHSSHRKLFQSPNTDNKSNNSTTVESKSNEASKLPIEEKEISSLPQSLPKNKDNIEDFCPGVLDRSFLEDLSPPNKSFQENVQNFVPSGQNPDSDSEDGGNPLVLGVQDDLDSDDDHRIVQPQNTGAKAKIVAKKSQTLNPVKNLDESNPVAKYGMSADRNFSLNHIQRAPEFEPVPEPIRNNNLEYGNLKQDSYKPYVDYDSGYEMNQPPGYDSPTWPLDTSVRRSPEGGEEVSVDIEEERKERKSKDEKKHKKSKKSSKDKEKSSKEKDGDKKERKHKEKKHKKKGSHEGLEEFLGGSDVKPDIAQEAYEAF